MDIRSSLREGLLTGTINIFIILLGLTTLVGTMVQGWFDLPSATLGVWLLLLGVALWGGARAGGRTLERSEKQVPLAGLVAGATCGLLVAILVWSAATVTYGGFELRKWLAQLTVEAIELLTFGLDPTLAALLDFALLTAAGLVGALLVLASARYGWRESLSLRSRTTTDRVRSLSAIQSFRQHKYSEQIIFGVVVALLGQHAIQEFPHLGVVLGHQDPDRNICRAGWLGHRRSRRVRRLSAPPFGTGRSRISTTVPRPGVLSTSTRPPCWRTILSTIARPRPVPSG